MHLLHRQARSAGTVIDAGPSRTATEGRPLPLCTETGRPIGSLTASPSDGAKGASWWSTAYHNVTAMVGAGVLGLPYTYGALGWGGGSTVLLVSLLISMFSFWLLVHLHEGELGRRFCRYHDLCQHAWGKVRGAWVLLILNVPYLFGLAITYTVTGGESLGSFASLVYTNGASSDSSLVLPLAAWIGIFSAVEVMLAQLPNLHSLTAVSSIGAVMSIGYSIGGSILSLRSPLPRNEVDFTPGAGGGADNGSPLQQFMGMTSAITTIFFAYGGHSIALEIQATLPFPPSTVRPMMRGVNSAFALTFVCYTLAATTGYWAFGSSVKDNILTSAGPSPLWLLAACRLGVVLHVVASYQVYSMVLMQLLEHWTDKLVASWTGETLDKGPACAGQDKEVTGQEDVEHATMSVWVPTPAPGLVDFRVADADLGVSAHSGGVQQGSNQSKGKGAAEAAATAVPGSAGMTKLPGSTSALHSCSSVSNAVGRSGGSSTADIVGAAPGLPAPPCAACLELSQRVSQGGLDGQPQQRQQAAVPPADALPASPLHPGQETQDDDLPTPTKPEAATHTHRPPHCSIGRAVRHALVRVLYVATTCIIACIIPFFGQLMGLIGAIGSTPTNFILPCLLWLTLRKPRPWRSLSWWLCWAIVVVGSVIGVLGAAGAVYGIVQASGSYKFLGT